MTALPLLLLIFGCLQDDVAEVPSEELQAGKNADKKYYLIGAKPDAKPREKGYGLVVVLPGNDGRAAFNPFVRRIFKNSIPDGYLMAQMVAVEWTPGQAKTLTWPTAKSPAKGMKFTTEEFFDAVVQDAAQRQKIDASRVYTLSWSSGGPPSYAIALRKNKPVAGSLIAMSVFHSKELDLTHAKGQAFYLYQSKEDVVTTFDHAEKAQTALLGAGADVELKTYGGGHGWRAPFYTDLRAGLEWLDKKREAGNK
jgi:predicted esterase